MVIYIYVQLNQSEYSLIAHFIEKLHKCAAPSKILIYCYNKSESKIL